MLYVNKVGGNGYLNIPYAFANIAQIIIKKKFPCTRMKACKDTEEFV